MYNVHDHNKNTLKAMCCRHSLALVTWSDTQEASLSSQSLSDDIYQSGQCGWLSHRLIGLDGAATKPVDVRIEEVRSLKLSCIYVLTCLGGGVQTPRQTQSFRDELSSGCLLAGARCRRGRARWAWCLPGHLWWRWWGDLNPPAAASSAESKDEQNRAALRSVRQIIVMQSYNPKMPHLFDFSEQVCVHAVALLWSHGAKVILHPNLRHQFVQATLEGRTTDILEPCWSPLMNLHTDCYYLKPLAGFCQIKNNLTLCLTLKP